MRRSSSLLRSVVYFLVAICALMLSACVHRGTVQENATLTMREAFTEPLCFRMIPSTQTIWELEKIPPLPQWDLREHGVETLQEHPEGKFGLVFSADVPQDMGWSIYPLGREDDPNHWETTLPGSTELEGFCVMATRDIEVNVWLADSQVRRPEGGYEVWKELKIRFTLISSETSPYTTSRATEEKESWTTDLQIQWGNPLVVKAVITGADHSVQQSEQLVLLRTQHGYNIYGAPTTMDTTVDYVAINPTTLAVIYQMKPREGLTLTYWWRQDLQSGIFTKGLRPFKCEGEPSGEWRDSGIDCSSLLRIPH